MNIFENYYVLTKKRKLTCHLILWLMCLTIYFWQNKTFSTKHKYVSVENSGIYLDKNRNFVNTTLPKSAKASDALDRISYTQKSNIPIYKVKSVSCEGLFNGDKKTYKRADEVQEGLIRNASQSLIELSNELDKCNSFRSNYINVPVNTEENNFRIAFSILIFKDLDQAARLLRAIYRPQNYYCLHIDATSPPELYDTAKKLVKCFDNVFLASRRVDVVWGWYSVVEPEIVCMKDLWKYGKWKYFINLTGQEFPLKTNLELVRILSSYNGANDIEGALFRTQNPSIRSRLKWSYQTERDQLPNHPKYTKPGVKKNKVPFAHNITWTKGQPHIAASRAFVDYLLHNPIGMALQQWAGDTSHASEHLFNPLQFSPQLKVPGSYTGNQDQLRGFTRYKNWRGYNDQPCAGKYSRDICIPGVRDLWQFKSSTKMFINKFHADFNPLAVSCLEERLFETVRAEASGLNRLNMSVYENSELALNHLTV